MSVVTMATTSASHQPSLFATLASTIDPTLIVCFGTCTDAGAYRRRVAAWVAICEGARSSGGRATSASKVVRRLGGNGAGMPGPSS